MVSATPFSTEGMNLVGIAPPTTALSKTKPPPRSRGSMRSEATPNWPWPPDCFLWRPSASPLPVIVSRYRTFTSSVSTLTPYFLASLSRLMLRCVSPMPRSSVWCVSSSRWTWSAGSSSCSRCSALASLSSSADVWAVMATDSTGVGRSSGGTFTGLPLAAACRRWSCSLSLATAPMSPAGRDCTGSVSLPRSRIRSCRRSSWPVRLLTRWSSGLIVPDSTLKSDTWPT